MDSPTGSNVDAATTKMTDPLLDALTGCRHAARLSMQERLSSRSETSRSSDFDPVHSSARPRTSEDTRADPPHSKSGACGDGRRARATSRPGRSPVSVEHGPRGNGAGWRGVAPRRRAVGDSSEMAGGESRMLGPLDTPTRERKQLSGLWRFALDADGRGRAEGWWRAPLAGASDVPVPASFNDVFADAEVHDHVDDVWYQTTARVPRGWDGRRVVLRFDSATHRASVWVDDAWVVDHEGGYTPFEADVTHLAAPGEQIRITAMVNNELSWQSIPPGLVEDTPDGKRQRYFHDFFNYAGLHRPVWLYSTPPAHVSDLTVVTDLAGSTGTVHYRMDTAGADGLEVRVRLVDVTGREMIGADGPSGSLRIPDVHPWRPGEGYLYDLVAELRDSAGSLVDTYPLPVGVRTVRVDGTRFLINGEPFYFRGFGKHEDAAVRGKGHDDAFMVHDFALMEWV